MGDGSIPTIGEGPHPFAAVATHAIVAYLSSAPLASLAIRTNPAAAFAAPLLALRGFLDLAGLLVGSMALLLIAATMAAWVAWPRERGVGTMLLAALLLGPVCCSGSLHMLDGAIASV